MRFAILRWLREQFTRLVRGRMWARSPWKRRRTHRVARRLAIEPLGPRVVLSTTVNLSDAWASEGDGAVYVSVYADPPSASAVTVEFSATSGDATADSDFTAPTSGSNTVTIAAGESYVYL
jgi:hypothetical protein